MGWITNPGFVGGTVPSSTTFTSDVAVGSFITMTASTGVIQSSANIVSKNGDAARTQIGDASGSSQAGVLFGSVGDAKLYRTAATALRTDSAVTIDLGIAGTPLGVNHYVAGQAPATSTQGTDTTPVSGTIFYGQVFIPANVTLTGISYLIGTVGGTNNVIVALYNNAGTLVKNSSLSGTLVGTLATMQRVPFTSSYAAVGPATYWVSVSMNGTTARLRTHTFGDHAAASATGVFGTLGNISPSSTFVANTAPYAMTY